MVCISSSSHTDQVLMKNDEKMRRKRVSTWERVGTKET